MEIRILIKENFDKKMTAYLDDDGIVWISSKDRWKHNLRNICGNPTYGMVPILNKKYYKLIK